MEAVHISDVAREAKSVTDLQKIFNVANVDSDTKAFDTLATQNIAKLNISTKDSKF